MWSAGSFFESVPEGDDAYILQSVRHDWYDPEADRILKTVRSAMRTEAVLLVVERILDRPNQGLFGKLAEVPPAIVDGR